MKQAYTILLKKFLNDGKAIFKATCLIHVNNTEIKRNHSNIGHSLHKPINNILCVSLSLLNIKHIQLQTFSAIQKQSPYITRWKGLKYKGRLDILLWEHATCFQQNVHPKWNCPLPHLLFPWITTLFGLIQRNVSHERAEILKGCLLGQTWLLLLGCAGKGRTLTLSIGPRPHSIHIRLWLRLWLRLRLARQPW